MSDQLMPQNKYFQRAQDLLSARLRWDTKQRMFYAMRHDGLPRVNKPFPTAADGHYPSIDMAIRRLKPFWMGQINSGEKLCVFASLKDQLDSLSDAAADYFDFTLNQRSNFLEQIRYLLDHMLLTGRGCMKAMVDPLDDYKVLFEAVHPMFMIVPQEAKNLDDADEFIHVRQFTVESYKRLDQRWDTSEETIRQIRGQAPANLGVWIIQKRLTEGIVWSTNTNQIIIWEHWKKTQGGHTVYNYSPLAPDIQLRPPHGNPYKVDGKESNCFYPFQMEVTDEGWYAPRGFGELLAPLEQYMTKVWNNKADAMTFAGTPLLTGDKETINSANYRVVPGEYIPGNIKSVEMRPVGVDFDREIAFAQGISEQQSQSPDFGITGNGEGQNTGGKPRTATENQRIAALQQSGSDDNAMMFRGYLARLYRHVWGMICQFKSRSFDYYAAGQTGTLPEQALHDQYLIAPDGSPEGWNRMARFQKAVGLMQAFGGNPNVDMEVLTKDALNAADGRTAQKAFIPTNLKGASEYEDEALIISALIVPGSGKPSFPATVKPNEDQPSRIKALLDWLHAATVKGTPIDEQSKTILHQRLAQRIQILKQQNPQAATQLTQQISQMEQASPTGAAQPQQPGQPMGNGQDSSGGQAGSGGNPPPQKPLAESLSIKYVDLERSEQAQVLQAIGIRPSPTVAPEPAISDDQRTAV